MRKKYIITIAVITAVVIACNKDVADAVFPGFQKPSNFPEPVYNFSNNIINKDGFELGKKLFYDPVLSADNTISCGSCHIQTSAFTHHGHTVSHGIFDRMGMRNSPPIMNLAWSNSLMWDGGVVDLDLQPIVPITNSVEMDNTMAVVLDRLRSNSTYRTMFKNAYGTEEITTARFLKALSQFMLMCVSSNAKYDSVMRNQSSFTNSEAAGYAIFKQKCNTCHKEPLFTDNSFRNNGLSVSNINDEGRYVVTQLQNDKYKFKVPSLRNLSYTAPYMHDGRLFTIDAVLDHYTTQVQLTPNLDVLLQQNTQPGIAINNDERSKLIAFLKTLDDRVFISNKMLSE